MSWRHYVTLESFTQALCPLLGTTSQLLRHQNSLLSSPPSLSPSSNDLSGLAAPGEVFFLNLEDGFFGCQVNSSVEVLQLFEISKLCDGQSHCYRGADEANPRLKCTSKFVIKK